MEVIENKGANLQDFGTSVQLAANLVRMACVFQNRVHKGRGDSSRRGLAEMESRMHDSCYH